jgi:23S rRNA-/tRNA-specific pseudouridylate synthase
MNFFTGSLHPQVSVVAIDPNGVAALAKPCDVLSIPNEDHCVKKNTLLLAPYDSQRRCYLLPNGREFFLLNRLDAPTSGLLIGCFDGEIAHRIRQNFAQQKVQKTYYALTAHRKIPERGTFCDSLDRTREEGHLRVRRQKGEPARTKYFIEKIFNVAEATIMKVRLEPITGRTHQLRVLCAARKIPIIVDKTYGDFTLNRKLWPALPRKRLYLQSCAIGFSYTFQGKSCDFFATIPSEF